MNKTVTAPRVLALVGLLLVCGWVAADSSPPPRPYVSHSANGQYRVTVEPRPLDGRWGYFRDEGDGIEPAGQPADAARHLPIARVEAREPSGAWRVVWQTPLVNDVAPVTVLLADDASHLVTFDNWHMRGYGDDVLVIYERDGGLALALSLEQILPADYARHIARSTSSRTWRLGQALVEGDRSVELKVVPPGEPNWSEADQVTVRIRLADGEVHYPCGEAWDRAIARAHALEEQRLAAWAALRALRAAPLDAPDTADTRSWLRYLVELSDRIETGSEFLMPMVLEAPEGHPGRDTGAQIAAWIRDYDEGNPRWERSLIVASPASDRLADVVVEALLARSAGSMVGAHLAFVGTPGEGERVAEAAGLTGARISVVDRTRPFPPGEPLPETPSPEWFPSPER